MFKEGLTVEEIERQTGIPIETVNNLLKTK